MRPKAGGPVGRGNDGLWKARKTIMPFSALPTKPWKSKIRFPHSPPPRLRLLISINLGTKGAFTSSPNPSVLQAHPSIGKDWETHWKLSLGRGENAHDKSVFWVVVTLGCSADHITMESSAIPRNCPESCSVDSVTVYITSEFTATLPHHLARRETADKLPRHRPHPTRGMAHPAKTLRLRDHRKPQ